MSSLNRFVCSKDKITVMSGTHRLNTNYRPEEAGKVVFKHCQCVIYLPKRYVEQMSDRVKSLGWILQLLSSLWCFSEAVLFVFIHLPLWVTAEQLSKKRAAGGGQKKDSYPSLSQITPTNFLRAIILALLFISGFTCVSIMILLQTWKVMSPTNSIPSY